MPRPVTPAQRAAPITFALKGRLKNVRIASVRAAALLATVGRKRHDTQRAPAASLVALRRRAATFETRPAAALADLDSASGCLNAEFGALDRAVRFAKPRGIRLAVIGGKSPLGWTRAVDRRAPRRAV